MLAGKVIIMHGGLFSRDDVTLADIRKIDRRREPPDEGLMSELLWSDPQPMPGRLPSTRARPPEKDAAPRPLSSDAAPA